MSTLHQETVGTLASTSKLMHRGNTPLTPTQLLLQVPTQLMECILGQPQAVQYVSQVHLEKLAIFVEVPRHAWKVSRLRFGVSLPHVLRAVLCPNQWLRAIRAGSLKVRCPIRSKLPHDETIRREGRSTPTVLLHMKTPTDAGG